MTTYNRGYEASLARYNARKRELQASMMEYSDHMRQIHAHKMAASSRLDGKDSPGSSLEVQAQSNFFTRHSNQSFLTKRLRHERRTARNRPSSLDEKELQLNSKIREKPKRDTKSEKAPVTIPTANTTSTDNPATTTLPPLVGPPNSPDFTKKGNIRVSFVSASDLYDLVDFGTSLKSSKKDSTRIIDVRDSLKLIEDIDLQNRRERNIAWEKQQAKTRSKDGSSPSRVSDNDFLTGKRIQPQSISPIPKNPTNNNSNNNNTALSSSSSSSPKSKHGQEKEKGKYVVRSEASHDVFPLNVLLQQAAASHLLSQSKVSTRPKRAKRMQLHKSSLLVIPEDGGTFVKPTDGKAASVKGTHQNSKSNDSDTKLDSTTSTSSSLTSSVEPDSNDSLNQQTETSASPRTRTEVSTKHIHQSLGGQRKSAISSLTDDKARKTILKRGGHLGSVEERLIGNLLITNSVYPPLPWERELNERRHREKHVSFDTRLSKVKARRKTKRLVFLRDQPEGE